MRRKIKCRHRSKMVKIEIRMDPYDYRAVKSIARAGRLRQRVNHRAFGGSRFSAVLAAIIRQWLEEHELAPPFLSTDELRIAVGPKKARSFAGAMRLIEEGQSKIDEGLGLLDAWLQAVVEKNEPGADGETPPDGGKDGPNRDRNPAEREADRDGGRQGRAESCGDQAGEVLGGSPGEGVGRSPGLGEAGFIHPPFP